jgi:hypothetical protein
VRDAYGALLIGLSFVGFSTRVGRPGHDELVVSPHTGCGFSAGLGLDRERLDLGQLGREGAPEDAAVRRHVEAVSRGVDDDVRVVLRDRDGEARRQAAAGLAPRDAGVVRDDERRLAVDDGDDRRADRGRSDDARQRELQRWVGLDGGGGLDLLGVEVDGEGAVRGLRDRPHRSAAPTTAVARRAAATGG